MFSRRFLQFSFPSRVILKECNSCFPVALESRSISCSSDHNKPGFNAVIDETASKIFFSKNAQVLMKHLTGLDLEVINRPTLLDGVKSPIYKFMTTEELEKTQKYAMRNIKRRLQMPPLVPVDKGETKIIEDRPELIGYTKSKYVFTDISFGISDRERIIVVRQPDGVLRQAYQYERHRMNQIFFPRKGRQYYHPKMFQPKYLNPLLEKGQFEFVLSRACCQYEPDDSEFHRVIFSTYEAINEQAAFQKLRSTRFYGPLVFYLCLKRNIDNLLLENFNTNRIEDAILAIKLYKYVHPECKFSSVDVNPEENSIEYIKKFIELESHKQDQLESALNDYLDEVDKNKLLDLVTA